jgi:ABC-2 type transport system ATP-binding protein
MDTEARHTTWQLIEELRSDGVSVLLTTHLLDEAEGLADDVVIMRSGAVAATGTPAELTAAAGIDLLEVRAEPGLVPDGRLAHLEVTETTPGEYAIAGALDAATIADVLGWFAAAGARVTAVNTRRRTLEDVYLALTTATGAGATETTATDGERAGVHR